ncbi:hypothetical protein HELRODRAFT_72182 [Helobdella robusta]|uniref:Protein ABHD13 n=1 Tax=Helobdella robusta TaxID=6412 RepID=T1G0W9_HELRO|nr:hypothetical protein HELRODRAFT_72182 [Helobdella robusta]ESO10691.1 hypothetical protein HELRODRAFT_72182 [Helobdella robusta]
MSNRLTYFDCVTQKLFCMMNHLWLYFSACGLIFYTLYIIYGSFVFIVLIFCSALGFLYHIQDSLLYQPNVPTESRLFVDNPSRFGLPYENIHLHTADGLELHAYLIKQPAPQSHNAYTVVFLHGNAGNIGHRLYNIHHMYLYCGVNVLMPEYRGYGLSQGTPSESGLYIDAQTAVDYILTRSDLNHSKIIIFGRSLGGAVAINAAASTSLHLGVQPASLIVENTFTNIRDMGKVLTGLSIIDHCPTFLIKNNFPSVEAIQHVKVPTLFICGLKDELVPPDMMRQLFEKSGSLLKRMFLVPNGTHNECWRFPGYYDQINSFFKEVH